MNPERRPAGAVVEMRFAQVSYGSVDSDAPASSVRRGGTHGSTLQSHVPFAISQIAQVAAAIRLRFVHKTQDTRMQHNGSSQRGAALDFRA